MKFRLLEPMPVMIALAGFMALALGIGSPASARTLVTEEEAEAAAVAASAMDAALQEEAGESGFLQTPTDTFDWSAFEEPPLWFPTLSQDDLMLTSPVERVELQSLADPEPAATATLIPNEHAVIPLPPAAWSGLLGLASLAAIHGRKSIIRFFS